jgi:hypothetical protein
MNWLFMKKLRRSNCNTQHFKESGFGNTRYGGPFVAEVDGIVQGFALYYIRYSTEGSKNVSLKISLLQNLCEAKN